MKHLRLVVALAFITSIFMDPILAEEKTDKPWKESAEFSLVSKNGNSKSTTISAKNTFIYNWTKSNLELIAGGLGTTSEGSTTAENYYASEKYAYNFTDKYYVYEKGRWDKDRFAGIGNRYDLSVGLGRTLLDRSKHNLILELGGGYINEQRRGETRNEFGSGRAYSKYVYTISETANFSQDAEYLHNFEETKDYRVNTETALTAAMSTHLSLKASYVVNHVNDPPKGFGKTDTTTSVALIVNY